MIATPRNSSNYAFRFWAVVTAFYWSALVAAMHVPMEPPQADDGFPIDKVFHFVSYTHPNE